jgi:hypothetical protein
MALASLTRDVAHDREEILGQIEQHRAALATLESRPRAAEPVDAPSPPGGSRTRAERRG